MGAIYVIVPELLTRKNYEWWKIWMKSYLLGEELWDIVEGTESKPDEATQVVEFKTWRKKNGKALHAIQLSCGPMFFKIISEMDSAKEAWDAIILNFKDSQTSRVQLTSIERHTEIPGRINDDNTWRIQLYEAVVKGDWKKTESLINSHNPEALSARLSMGETILHTAVLNNHVHLVVELVKKMSPRDTEITLPYRDDSTALHIAAARGIMKIAEVLVKKNDNLLRLRDNRGYLPITRASLRGEMVMVRYLYPVTPKEELLNFHPIGGIEGANLLTQRIAAEDYDFALKIHGDHPQLTFVRNVIGAAPLEVLAGKPSAFPSGNRLKFWQRWIYNCIHGQQSRTSNNCTEDSVQAKVSNWLKELSWDVAKIFGGRDYSTTFDKRLYK